MKILICHNYYKDISGEDIVIAEDIRILKERQLDVIDYARSNRDIDDYSLFQKARFITNTVYSNKTVHDIDKIIRTVKPDVALVQNVFPLISPSIYHVLYANHIPVIQLVYNYRLICPNAILFTEGKICERCIHGNFAHAIVHKCFRNSYALSALYAVTLAAHRRIGDLSKLITAYITPDQFLKNKLVEGGFPGDRIFPVLNPFDVTQYAPSFAHKNYFVYFGRIVHEKGIFTLLEAIKTLPNTKLMVVGDGDAYIDAKEFVLKEQLSNVHFTGPKYGESLIEILRDAMAVIVPTLGYDNSPLVVHQAFALGKPVIASEIDGIPEIVRNNETGLLFPPGDTNELAEKIRLIERDHNLLIRLSTNARNYAEREFTARQRYDGLMNVIDYTQQKKTRK
jgi:glycosyltransferase involved in cell wall biosynthesis